MLKRLAIGIAAILITTTAAQAQCPQLKSSRQLFALNEGFTPDPLRLPVTAGGELDIGRCAGVPGKGWVARLPDFSTMYRTKGGRRSGETLIFTTNSNTDTILLINDPSGRWHWDDDSGSGLNGRIRFRNALPGRYDIWVGTFDRGLTKVQLIITEIE
jgi:hypothetical protein